MYIFFYEFLVFLLFLNFFIGLFLVFFFQSLERERRLAVVGWGLEVGEVGSSWLGLGGRMMLK